MAQVIDQFKEKLRKISIPRGIRVFKVLIHDAPLSEDLIEKDYFERTVLSEDFIK